MKSVLASLLLLCIIAQAYPQQAKLLRFVEEIHDFGTILEEGGPVTHDFIFTNNSARPVKILSVKASCGCTTPAWSEEPVPAGKTGFIQARFDPRGRPGFFDKSLTVTTDLEPTPVVLRIRGEVSGEGMPSEDAFPVADGGLRFEGSAFNMGKVFLKDEYVLKEFPVFNASDQTITFSPRFVTPPYIKIDVEPKLLAPGKEGVVRVSYNGKMKARYGFQSDNVELHTDDKVNPVKSVTVYATLEDYFPQLTAGELANAPRLRIASRDLDFGTVRGPVSREVEITNTGREELHVRALQPNCICVRAEASEKRIGPGGSGTIKIVFDPQGRNGTQKKAVTVYTNDPRNPVQLITFSAYVE